MPKTAAKTRLKPSAKRSPGTRAAPKLPSDVKPSELKIFDIPDKRLIDSPDNPQEMDDATLDELVEGIRTEGIDEPLHVIPVYDDAGKATGKYMIVSGHHRRKAGRIAGLTKFPAVIKPDMDEAARKIALVRRNQLKGNFNSKKFTALFREVSPLLGAETTKRLMGFTKEAAFKKVFEDVGKSLGKVSPEAKATLERAKEKVKSVDDLSTIINGIFKREGQKASKGYMVFSYSGKKHYYFKIDNSVAKMLDSIVDTIADSGASAEEVWKSILNAADARGYTVPIRREAGAKPKRKLRMKKRG